MIRNDAAHGTATHVNMTAALASHRESETLKYPNRLSA
jgi:hypothetical protein